MKKMLTLFILLIANLYYNQENFLTVDTLSLKNNKDLLNSKIYKANDREIKFLVKNSIKKFKMIYTYTYWCKPCREKFPKIQKIEKEYDEKLEVFYLNDIAKPSDIDGTFNYLKSIQLDKPIFTLWNDPKLKDENGKIKYKIYNPEKGKITNTNRYMYYTQKLLPNHQFYGYSLVLLYNEMNEIIYASTYKETDEEIINKIIEILNKN